MSDHEQDKKSGSEQARDEHKPAELTRHEPPEDLTETSGQRNDPVGAGVNPSLTTNDFGDNSPHNVEPNDEQTLSDLEESDVDLVAPQPRAQEMVITITEHKIETESENAPTVESVTSVGELADVDLQRLRRVMDEEAARRGVQKERPFKNLDLDSLQVLYNQVRAELGQR